MNRLLAPLVNFFLPARCPCCGEEVSTQGGLCQTCWQDLHFLSEPLCHRCGFPFEITVDTHMLCGACIKRPPPYARLRAVLRYDDASKRLILRFKHGDATYLTPLFCTWMRARGADLLKDAQIIAPVPLHWTRLLSRGYNQAALLAQGLARGGDLLYIPDLLLRVRKTASQGKFSKAERQSNVEDAFAVNPKYAKVLRGRRVLVVDDVHTSGATVHACARTLEGGGVLATDVLTLAKVVRTSAYDS